MPRPSRRHQQRFKKQLRKLGIPKPGADTSGNVADAATTPAEGEVSPAPSNSAGGGGIGEPLARHFSDPHSVSRADLNMLRHLVNLGCFSEQESQVLFRAMGNVIAKSPDDRAKVNAFRALTAAYGQHVRAAATNRPLGDRVAAINQTNITLHAEARQRRDTLVGVCRELGIDPQEVFDGEATIS